MNSVIRKTNINDLNDVYNLHLKCFDISDQWYKYIISQHLNDGFVIELTENKKIIGILLQGIIIPCENINSTKDIFGEEILNNDNIDNENFISLNKTGDIFIQNMEHIKKQYGIIMLCIDPLYRGKGLATKLINIHIKKNPNKLLCLNTRKSNIVAYELYKKIGYNNIAYIKNKYYLPTEDSQFMIINYNK
jgi:ribosomal protein S18 acetylase RimI-like enzyme